MTNKTILICDDDEGILDMLELVLEDSGFNIIPEKNSLNVYNVVEKQRPDLLLVDLWMPVLSGDQVVRTLKNNPNTRDLPIVVISASTDGKQIAEQAGANDFIAKPFDVDTLINRLNKLLN